MKIIYEGVTYEIDYFGLFHSLIGDLAPLSKGRLAGGHCNYQNMLSSIAKVVIQEELPHGFQQARIYNLRKPSNFKNSTLFSPLLTPEECLDIAIESIQNPQKIVEISKEKNTIKKSFELTHQNGYKIEVHINQETKTAKFNPSRKQS